MERRGGHVKITISNEQSDRGEELYAMEVDFGPNETVWRSSLLKMKQWEHWKNGVITMMDRMIGGCLVGNVVDMLPTCFNVGQMSKNFEINTNVHYMEKFFDSESRLWHVVVTNCERPWTCWQKIYLQRKYYFDAQKISNK